jgi:hypothetical protein
MGRHEVTDEESLKLEIHRLYSRANALAEEDYRVRTALCEKACDLSNLKSAKFDSYLRSNDLPWFKIIFIVIGLVVMVMI